MRSNKNSENDVESQLMNDERVLEARFIETMKEIENKNQEMSIEVSSSSPSVSLGNNNYDEEQKSPDLRF